MASIFSNAMNFLQQAFVGAISTDMLRDYRHATELFVTNDFSLLPKSTYLFHVFFDINNQVAYPTLATEDKLTELGMLVKDVDLPKFSVDSKIYNAYNRTNLVQSKIKFNNINITFRDDSVNTVRNFWFDYYNYYYRDTMNSEQLFRGSYKYNPSPNSNFGYGPRQKALDHQYLRSIRIYSLSHGIFSEYILLNPIITEFRHSKHDYEANETAGMSHEMTIAYEGVLYNDGYLTDTRIPGYAQLHYDRTQSPLARVGSRRQILGRNGLIGTVGSIISDLSSGTVGGLISGIFKAATARQTFKGFNFKKAAVNELRQIYTQTATNAVVGLINNQSRTTTPGGITVIHPNNPGSLTGSNNTGIGSLGSALLMTGVAAVLNSKSTSNNYKNDPVTQSNKGQVPSNYNPQFPRVPGATTTANAPSNILKANDSNEYIKNSSQFIIDVQSRKIELSNTINKLDEQIRSIGYQSGLVQKQIATLDLNLANLNTKLQNARSANAPTDIINGILQQIESTLVQKQSNQARLTSYQADITSLQAQLTSATAERSGLRNG